MENRSRNGSLTVAAEEGQNPRANELNKSFKVESSRERDGRPNLFPMTTGRVPVEWTVR